MWTSIGEFLKKSYPFIIEGFLIFIILYVQIVNFVYNYR